MHGQTCPACGRLPIPFGRFLLEVEPCTVMPCPGCATTLRRSRGAFGLLAGLGVAFGAVAYLVGRATLADPDAAGLLTLAALFLAAPAVFFVAFKFVGWRFVPWRRVAADGARATDGPLYRSAR